MPLHWCRFNVHLASDIPMRSLLWQQISVWGTLGYVQTEVWVPFEGASLYDCQPKLVNITHTLSELSTSASFINFSCAGWPLAFLWYRQSNMPECPQIQRSFQIFFFLRCLWTTWCCCNLSQSPLIATEHATRPQRPERHAIVLHGFGITSDRFWVLWTIAESSYALLTSRARVVRSF